MKLKIKKLGRISSAELEIKPLTVFIGKNNTNKTWSAYALYGVLRSLTWFMRSGFSPANKILPSCPRLDTAISKITDLTANAIFVAQKSFSESASSSSNEHQTFTLSVARDDIFHMVGSIGSEPIEFSFSAEHLGKLLAIDPGTFTESVASVELGSDFILSHGQVKSLTFAIGKQQTAVTVTISGVSQDGSTTWPVYTFSTLLTNLTFEYIREQIKIPVRWLASALYRDVLAFPADRKAITALATVLEPSLREEKLRTVLNVPSSDFASYLLAARSRPDNNQAHAKIVNLLEHNVMSGRVGFKGPVENRSHNYTSDAGPEIQIHAVSSLVRSLAGLDVYLTHHSHGVMIVDEPEMNAHPEAQLELLEVFSMLVNQGLQIVITTHSPYILDHLNNLMAASHLSAEKKRAFAQRTKLRDADAFISPDKVAAYVFNINGTVKNILEDGIIDVESFADESDYVANLYSEIQAALGEVE